MATSSGTAKVTLPSDTEILSGSWRYALEAEGGMEVAFRGEYQEIVPNEKIVTTEVFEGAPDDGSEPPLNIVTFEEIGERTLLTLLVKCPTKQVRDTIIESGVEQGMQAGYDELEQVAISLR